MSRSMLGVAQFVASTPNLRNVRRLFHDGFHDPARALGVLHEIGDLEEVTDAGGVRKGLRLAARLREE